MHVFDKDKGFVNAFGPFSVELKTNSYQLQIFKDDGFVDNIDISDEDKSNWMMFVRPARNTAEQNVVVYQQDEHIFFVSIKVCTCNIFNQTHIFEYILVNLSLKGYLSLKYTESVVIPIPCSPKTAACSCSGRILTIQTKLQPFTYFTFRMHASCNSGLLYTMVEKLSRKITHS